MEQNTFNLPVGSRLYPVIKGNFDRQAVQIVSRIRGEKRSAFLDPVASIFDVDFDNLEDELVVIVAILSTIWLASRLRAFREWDVDPRAIGNREAWRKAIREQGLDFSKSTQETFRKDVAANYEKLKNLIRKDIEAGLIDASESTDELADRLKKYFQDSNRARARRIARTESVNAYHRSMVYTAKELGNIPGFSWKTAEGACDLCLAIEADENAPEGRRRVRIGNPFAIVNGRKIMHPTAHPNCMCSMIAVFADQDTGYWSPPLVR
jgi:hypothetical protein